MTSEVAAVVVDAREVLLIADDPQAGREVDALADEHGWLVEGDAASAGEGHWRVRRR